MSVVQRQALSDDELSRCLVGAIAPAARDIAISSVVGRAAGEAGQRPAEKGGGGMSRTKEAAALAVDPRSWEAQFGLYLHSAHVSIDSLVNDYEQRSFYARLSGPICDLVSRVRLDRAALASLKLQIARRTYEAGGEYRTRTVIIRSADGLMFTVHLLV